MATSTIFLINLGLVALFGLLMLGEALRRTPARQSASAYWTFHKPLWRSLIEPESVLAISAATLAVAIVTFV